MPGACLYLPLTRALAVDCWQVLASVEVQKPRIPVVSNVDAKAHSDPAVIKSILTKQASRPHTPAREAWCLPLLRPLTLVCVWVPFGAQVTAPVQWETIMKDLVAAGYEKGYELGPGKVLSGIMKRVDKKAPPIENVEV